MNNLFRILSAVFVAVSLSMPVMAQGRHSGGNNRQSTERRVQNQQSKSSVQSQRTGVTKGSGTTNRSSQSVNRGNNGSISKPSIVNKPNSGLRPGSGNQPSVQPVTGNQNSSRPGHNNNQSGLRPGAGNQQPGNSGGNNNQMQGLRPGAGGQNQAGQRPGAGQQPSVRPNPTPQPQPPLHRPPMAPTMRPDRPPMYPYSRPVPPPSWRPTPGGPILSTILGIVLGTAIGTSLDYLFANGYAVDGYDSNVVYLRNVNQLNYAWPDAALYYGPYGLAGSRFIYSTPMYDPYRYNMVYRDLVRLYGSPAQLMRQNGGYLATWFGVGNNYVQLQFAPETVNGTTRFFTTLSFGN